MLLFEKIVRHSIFCRGKIEALRVKRSDMIVTFELTVEKLTNYPTR